MSERGLSDLLVAQTSSPVIYPALLFDLKFGGYAPPFTPPAGQLVAWSVPTVVAPTAHSVGSTSGLTQVGLQQTTLTKTATAPLADYDNCAAIWSNFTAPNLPAGAVVEGIYAVAKCHAVNNLPANGSAAGQMFVGNDLDLSSVSAGGGSGFVFETAPFDGVYFSGSLGTDLSLITSSGFEIGARLWQTLLQPSINVSWVISQVAIAVYYTGAQFVGVEPVPDGGNVYHVWTGIGQLVANGYTYIGVGSAGKVTTIADGTGVEAKGVTLTLSGIDPVWLAESMNEVNMASSAKIWLAFLNPAAVSIDTLVVDTPTLLFQGIMDGPQLDMDTSTFSISIDVESKMVDLNRSRGGRYTDQDQQVRYPGDTGLQFASLGCDRNIVWSS